MVLFFLFLLLIFLGIPVAFSFAIAGLLYVFITGDFDPSNLVTIAFGGLDSFVLMAVPFFIFAGDLMKHGGITSKLIGFSRLFFGKKKSALGGIAVLTSTFFGAISGSSAASVAAVGSIMVPEMEKEGIKKTYSSALIAASGFIGILIPPSIPLIIYGLSSGASIGDLFLAGIIPGIIVTVVFVVINIIMTKSSLEDNSVISNVHVPKSNFFKQALDAVPGLLLPVIILGGIYSGIFTPTEAAAIAVVYGFIIGKFIYKSFTFKELPKIALESAITSATILIIIGFASFFGRLMTLYQVPATISNFLMSLTENTIILLLLINLLLLFLGMFLETSTAIMILTPILLPLAARLGVDPVHFGIIMIMNLSIGLITPPMALNLFVASQVSNLSIDKLVKPIMPFLIASIFILILLTLVPSLSMMLPNIFG